jgi:hypothetical protein
MTVNVNRVAYDTGNMELELAIAGGDSLGIINFTEINYKDKVDRTKLREGGARTPIDATDGDYDADGSMSFHRYQFQRIAAQLAEKQIGWYDAEFNITVNYANKKEPLHTDTITRVKFGSRDRSNSQGTDSVMVKCDLFIIGLIYEDGIGPFGEKL